MGCCLTTAAAATNDIKTQPKTRDTSPPGSGEETIKQVLSETPITSTKPPPTKLTGGNNNNDVVHINNNPVTETASEVSSEVYTYSAASLSTITTTTIGTGVEVDDDGEVTQKVNNPPPVKMVSRRPPVTCSGDPARRKERGGRPPAPVKRQVTSRTVTTAQRYRNVVSSRVVGREPVRRSRSPAVNNFGKRVPVKVREKKVNDVGVMPAPVPEICESLDNPLVSLECFIFL